MNTTITHPIGRNRGNAAAIERDVRLINRIRQNMLHEQDAVRAAVSRRKSRHQRLALFAPC